MSDDDQKAPHDQHAAALAMAASIRTELRPLLKIKFDGLPANLKWVAVFQELLEREAEDRKTLNAKLDQIIQFQNANTPGRRPVAGFTFHKKEIPVATSFTIGDTEFIDITFAAVDSLQEPTAETLPLTVASSDETIAKATLLNETTIRVQSANVAGQPLGDVQVTLSDGTATGSFGVTVKAGPVASFQFSGGTPQPIAN